MSKEPIAPQDSEVRQPELDQGVLNELVELVQSPYKKIYQDGPMTVIEFENGQILPLQGGGSLITSIEEESCSFCGQARSQVAALASAPEREDLLICPDCATGFVELFAKHGVAINLNIPAAPELAEALASLRSRAQPEGEKE